MSQLLPGPGRLLLFPVRAAAWCVAVDNGLSACWLGVEAMQALLLCGRHAWCTAAGTLGALRLLFGGLVLTAAASWSPAVDMT